MSSTVNSSAIATPNVLWFCKVWLSHRSLANLKHVKWRWEEKHNDRYYRTSIICFCPLLFAPVNFGSRRLLLSRRLTVHLYVAPSMANLRSPLRTHRLPKQAIPTFSSQSLHSNDVLIQHAAMQLHELHALKKGMSQNSCPVHSCVDFTDGFRADAPNICWQFCSQIIIMKHFLLFQQIINGYICYNQNPRVYLQVVYH